jgi:hypothetical protein
LGKYMYSMKECPKLAEGESVKSAQAREKLNANEKMVAIDEETWVSSDRGEIDPTSYVK